MANLAVHQQHAREGSVFPDPRQATSNNRQAPMSQTIRVKPTHDGTYTVYQGPMVLISGLTRLQAERYEASIARQSRPQFVEAPAHA